MTSYADIEKQFAAARPPRAGSASWYDACDLPGTQAKSRLREPFERGFHAEVYGDEVGLILRVRGDGYGAKPWSVDRALVIGDAFEAQIAEVLDEVAERVRDSYVGDAPAPSGDEAGASAGSEDPIQAGWWKRSGTP